MESERAVASIEPLTSRVAVGAAVAIPTLHAAVMTIFGVTSVDALVLKMRGRLLRVQRKSDAPMVFPANAQVLVLAHAAHVGLR